MWQTNKTETLFFVGYKTTLQINNNQPKRADSPDPRTLKQKRFTDEDVRVAETFVL